MEIAKQFDIWFVFRFWEFEVNFGDFVCVIYILSRSQWARGLRHRSAAARLLKSWVRIPPGGMDIGLL